MIQLSSLSDQNAVLEALDDPDGFTAIPVLLIGNEDYGERMVESKWGQTRIPITLDATLAGILPRRLEGAPVSMYVSINGVLVPQLVGRYTSTGVGGSSSGSGGFATTELLASSSGALLPRVKLREFVEYEPQPPEAIVRDAIYRVADVGGYDKGRVEIEALGAPLLSFAASDGFKPQESAGDVLSKVLQQIAYDPFDTAANGLVCRVDPGLGRVGDVVSRTYDARDMPDWAPPGRAEEQYSAVEVYRENPDGTDAYRQMAEVVYRGIDYPPIANAILQIPLNDDTADGPKNAQRLANERAELVGRGLYKGQVTLPGYHALIERKDTLRVNEVHRDDDGLWDRVWLLGVDGYQHSRAKPGTAGSRSGSMPGISTQIAYTATLLIEDPVRVPALIVPNVSPGVLVTPGDPYGSTSAGFWFDSRSALGIGGQPWIGLDEIGGWIDPALTDRAGRDGAGFWFEWPGEPYGHDGTGFWYDPNFVEVPQPWMGLDATGGWINPAFTDQAGYEPGFGFWFEF